MRRLPVLLTAVAAAFALPFAVGTPAGADGTAPGSRSLALTPTPGSTHVRGVDGSLRLTGRTGFASLRAVRLGHRVQRVTLDRDATVPAGASVTLWVRAGLDAGGWSEWTEATAGRPTALPVASRTVQVRVALAAAAGDGPTVRGVGVTPGPAVAAGRRLATKPYRAKVYATREGLVGGTTANGHKIRKNDRFVALPSARALSDKGSDDYSVKVCTSSRCAWASVWDVGPWNIKDDYWNPKNRRETWQDLPRGRPEAEAAYYDGYHKGKDASGRKVVNPAGIDLADGTFWKDLKLEDNSWVTVTYLWTGSNPQARVSSPEGMLNVRHGASTSAPVVGTAADGASVAVACRVSGQRVAGPVGTTAAWYRVAPGMYVSGGYLALPGGGRRVRSC
ncbi:MAG TPA: hypothetical protein VF053_21425 [Streptosporangiales bacterium]